jgi:hypothetical protein
MRFASTSSRPESRRGEKLVRSCRSREHKNPRTRPRRARDDIPSANGEALTRVLAYLGAICTSFSFSVIFIPRCSRRNRISEDGSVEEYTPLT